MPLNYANFWKLNIQTGTALTSIFKGNDPIQFFHLNAIKNIQEISVKNYCDHELWRYIFKLLTELRCEQISEIKNVAIFTIIIQEYLW